MDKLPKGIKMDNSKIEAISINRLESIILDSHYLESYFNKMDKELSWDGYIYSYNNLSHTKNNLNDKIPVQIKGHFDEDENELKKEFLQHPIDLEDLENYYADRGVLYFVIYISYKSFSIYYNMLFPSKIKTLLDTAKRKKNKHSINASFLKLENKGSIVRNICLNFTNQTRKQGSGLGQIVPYSENIKNIGKIKEDFILYADGIGVDTITDLLGLIENGNSCLYIKKKNDSIFYPIEIPINNSGSFIAEQYINNTISINNKIFYNRYKIKETSNKDDFTIYFSNNLSLRTKDKTIKLKLNGTLEMLYNDVLFLDSLLEYKEMHIGDNSILKIEDKDYSQTKYVITFIKTLYKLFKIFQVNFKDEFNSLSKQELITLNELCKKYYSCYELENNSFYTFSFQLKNKEYCMKFKKENDKLLFYKIVE